MKKLTLIIAILLLGQISAKTVIVDQSGAGDATTIQNVFNYTAAGDTVLVRPGMYIEEVKMPNIKLYLIGSGADVTTIYYISTAVFTGNTDQTISDFNIISTTGVGIQTNSNINTIITIKRCVIQAAQYAIDGENGKHVNNSVIDSSGGGIRVYSEYTKIQNNVFYNNSSYCVRNYSNNTITVENNIFIDNTTVLYKQDGDDYILSIYNCFYNNGLNFSNGAIEGIGDLIDTDPKFDDVTKSYLLNSDSPTRDAGNPAAPFNDGDGSRNDMGIYGGTNSWGTGPVITDLSISPTTINQGGTITIEATAKKK